MELKFATTDDFRANATAEDYEELLKCYNARPTKDWDKNYGSIYGFSRTSAGNLLEEKKKSTLRLDIASEKLVFKAHTCYVTDDVWRQINELYNRYPSVKNTYVLDAFLRAALENLLQNQEEQ